MTIQEIIQKAVVSNASDIFLVAGLPLTLKCGGTQRRDESGTLMPADTKRLIEEIYSMSSRNGDHCLVEGRDDDFSFSMAQLGRFRVNVFHQRGALPR